MAMSSFNHAQPSPSSHIPMKSCFFAPKSYPNPHFHGSKSTRIFQNSRVLQLVPTIFAPRLLLWRPQGPQGPQGPEGPQGPGQLWLSALEPRPGHTPKKMWKTVAFPRVNDIVTPFTKPSTKRFCSCHLLALQLALGEFPSGTSRNYTRNGHHKG